MAKKKITSKQNGKKGGRPKGRLNDATLERKEVLKMYRERVSKITDHLLNKQLELANGLTFLYKIEKYWEGKGKNKVLKQRAPKQVTDQWEIEAFLENEIDGGDMESSEDTYYFITTKAPDGKAIDSMLNRALGKPVQSVNLSDDEGNSIFDDPDKDYADNALDAIAPKKASGKNKRNTKK